jgi:RHS repeat-associated protein
VCQNSKRRLKHRRVTGKKGGLPRLLVPDPGGPEPRMHSFIKTTFALDATRSVSRDDYFDGRGMLARTFGFLDPARGDSGTVDLEYDGMGRLLRTSNPYYAPQGPNTPVNPTNRWTTNRYDGLGRVDLVTLPDATTVSTLYQGRVVTVTDQAGKKRRSLSDALDRLEHLDEPNASGNLGTVEAPEQRTTYLYDVLDNLLRITQGQQSRFFRYDGLSRLTHERHVEQAAPHAFTDAETGNNQWSRHIEYNGQSLVTDTYDARNVHTHFEYDGVNRLKEITHNGETAPTVTPRVTLFYDEVQTGFFNQARMTRAVTDATADAVATEVKFNYDRMGRVSNQTQTISPALGAAVYTMSYNYNFLDQLTSETYPSGRVVTNGYDATARLNQVADQFRTYTSLMAYTAQATLESETWGNGAVHTMAYNDRLQLQQLRLLKNGSELQRFDYAYGQVNINDGTVDATKNNGQIGRVENFVNGVERDEQRHVYDALGRLEAMRGVRDGNQISGEYRLHYTYDRFGNRYQPAGDTQNVNIRYTPVETSHIDTSTNRFTAATQVQHDASGNVTTDGKFRGLSYRYDANNRMKEARWDDQLGVSNSVYDGLGQRVRTTINGEWHHYVYDAMGRVIAEYGPSGTNPEGGLVRERIYRGGQLIATDEKVGLCRRTAEQFVREFYWGALGRQPNPQELGQWAALIGASVGQARLNNAKALGDTIFTSTEYLNRQRMDEEFVADLYWTYLQRPADVDGLKFWVERIALQGREGVREGFELSNEFAAHVADICTPGEPRSDVLWVMQDHQRSTRAMLNSAGQVVGRHDALPFGDTTGEANEVGPQAPEDETTGLHGWWNTIRQQYAGLERDATTGLEHATFRKYEPWAGRWTSPDPYLGSMNTGDPQSFNRYAYVNNDPVSFVDPSGLLMAGPDTRYGGAGIVWRAWFGNNNDGWRLVHEWFEPYPDGPQDYDSRADFRDYGRQLLNNGKDNDCLKLALLVYKAGQIWGDRGAGAIINGLLSQLTEITSTTYGRRNASDPNFRVGVEEPGRTFGQSGFRQEFQDRESPNQVRHFIAYLALGYAEPRLLADAIAAGRDLNNQPDRALGYVGNRLGNEFKGDYEKLAQDIWYDVCGQASRLNLR